jgi:hypothetical protein
MYSSSAGAINRLQQWSLCFGIENASGHFQNATTAWLLRDEAAHAKIQAVPCCSHPDGCELRDIFVLNLMPKSHGEVTPHAWIETPEQRQRL